MKTKEEILKEVLENNIRHNISIREKNMMREAIALTEQATEKRILYYILDKIKEYGVLEEDFENKDWDDFQQPVADLIRIYLAIKKEVTKEE